MRTSFKSVVAGVVTLCVAGVMAAAGASSASAAAAPFDPDPTAYGAIIFHNASGAVVTSGDATDPLSMAYAESSVAPPAGNTTSRASLNLFLPVPAQPTGLWGGIQLNGNTIYPIATAPAPLNTSTHAVTQMLPTSTNVRDAILAFIPNTAAGYVNLWQMRLYASTGRAYAATTISVDPATNIWTQTFPVPSTATTTALTVSPSSPANAPANVTLTANIAPTSTAGSVQFFENGVSLGSSTVTAGVATLAVPAVAVGNYSLTATFTPTDAVTFASSTSSVVPFVVQVPKPTPAVALTATSVAPNFGSSDTFTANVGSVGTPAVTPAGTIQFFNNGVSLGAAAATDATGMASLTTSALTVGSHAVTATFVPTDLVTYNGSTSPAVTVNVLAVQVGACATTPANCTDAQPFVATVPAGSLVISTPYLAANPFNLGTMVLNAAGTQYTTTAAFGNAGSPASGVTITDTRAGGLGWTASLQSGVFTNNTVLPVGVINGGNLGFAGVAPQYIAGNALNVAPGNVVSVFDNVAPAVALGSSAVAPALSLANPQKFASAAIGAGSVNVTGLFTLNAPSSIPAGLYGGTVTFTIA
jgi:hypothetical protein